MKVKLDKRNIVIKISVKKLKELFGDSTNSVIPVSTATGEIKLEEPIQDANIQSETPTTDTVVPASGSEPSAPVQ
jgi:hypothetical protein